jgi:hypothetical protein
LQVFVTNFWVYDVDYILGLCLIGPLLLFQRQCLLSSLLF